MSWRRWKLGAAVALLLSLLVAGAGVGAGGSWRVFVASFCTAALTHFFSFLKNHPVDAVDFNGGDHENTTVPDSYPDPHP